MINGLRHLPPKSDGQTDYVESIKKNTITFCTGHAGTGKTLLGLHTALQLLKDNPKQYTRLIIVRPYIQSNLGEKIGSLPGTLGEKVEPFVESIRDNLRQILPIEEMNKILRNGTIEFTVLSTCRGRSFTNSVILVEEAQNCPIQGESIKLLLTRIGRSCKMILAGDLDQRDIPEANSALPEAIRLLSDVDGIGIVGMREIEDIQRSPLVKIVLERYGQKNSI